MRSTGDCLCEKCGGAYWRKSRQWHKCLPPETVVNEISPVVVNRNKDRHKKTPERLEYIRNKMREYRKKAV